MKIRSRAYTLIEILVVMLIISVMMGVVAVNIPTNTSVQDRDQEARRLQLLLDLASEEAVLRGSEIGFLPQKRSYRFFLLDEGARQWREMLEAPFQARNLAAGVELEVMVEGVKLDVDDENEPPILLLSSGEKTPFEIRVRNGVDDNSPVALTTDGYSPVELTDAEF